MRVFVFGLFLVLGIFRGPFRPTSAEYSDSPAILQSQIVKRDVNKLRNCDEIKLSGDTTSGVRKVYPIAIEGLDIYSVEVYCDQNTDEGGWTVIQKREPIPVRENFYRPWNEYVQGFGDLNGELWLGLEHIHALTSSTKMELRVDLEDFEGEKRWAKYKLFQVGDSKSKYILSIANYSGDAGDGFTPSDSASVNLNGMKFSTHDQDNDLQHSGNCAKRFKGAWWFNDCHRSHLNGLFDDGIIWYPFGGYHPLNKASMKIRPSVSTREEKSSSTMIPESEQKSPKNCGELKLNGDSTSGVKIVYPYINNTKRYTNVFCDQSADGGGWTVIQTRDDVPTRENFARPWDEYVKGFGDLNGEFWLGLDNIHALTSSAQMELRVDIEDWEGNKRWAKYGTFHVGDADSKYVLAIGNYTGDAGDGVSHLVHKGFNLNGMKFSTNDQDNDLWPKGSCAKSYGGGGWWFNYCHGSNLNGYQYEGKHTSSHNGINWLPLGGKQYSFKKVSMKIRPVSQNR